jgi:hypothetical protein
LKRQKGENFNVFLITGIGERETLFCKMIHDLLNPKGSHGQNNLYLRLFVQEVLKLPSEAVELKYTDICQIGEDIRIKCQVCDKKQEESCLQES